MLQKPIKTKKLNNVKEIRCVENLVENFMKVRGVEL